MTQIYNFEDKIPPAFNKKMLMQEIKRRETKRQVLILRIASVLVCLCMVLFALVILPYSKFIAVACIIITTFSIIGNGVITLLFYRKGICFN